MSFERGEKLFFLLNPFKKLKRKKDDIEAEFQDE